MIIKNCPCYINMPLYNHDKVCRLGDIVKPNHKELYVHCEEITDCLLKRIYEDVKTVYKNPEYFEELYKKGDREQIIIESAWHNVAHMVISKLEIEESENND